MLNKSLRVECKNPKCSNNPLKSIADEKRGYCIQCYPANMKCNDKLPRKDRKAHRQQFPDVYKVNISRESLYLGILIIAFITIKFFVKPTLYDSAWEDIKTMWQSFFN